VARIYIPSRGDVIWLEFTSQQGREQAGRRPAVVLSPRAYNQKVGLAVVCPITSQVKGYPFEVRLPEGLRVEGVILCDQLKSLDWKARKASKLGSVTREVMEDVTGRVLALVDPE
jgi:mRNA interferase MazF